MCSVRRVVAIAVLAVGCSSAASTPPAVVAGEAQATPDSRNWTLTFELSGGIAGFMRRLRISSTGDLFAEDLRRNVAGSARAGSDEIAQLNSFVAAGHRDRKSRSASCRDCLEYVVDIDVNGRRSRLELDDLSLQDSDLTPVINLLSTLLDRTIREGTPR